MMMVRNTRSNVRKVSALCLLTGRCPDSRYGDKRTVGTEFLGKRSEVIEYVKNTPECDGCDSGKWRKTIYNAT